MTVNSLADEIRRLHDLCELRRIVLEDEARPRWMRWFNAFWSGGSMAVILLLFVLVTKLPSNMIGIASLVLLPLAALGLIHMLVADVIEIIFMVKDAREEKKPFSRMESKQLPELIRGEIELGCIDPGVVDHVIASQETNAAILLANLNWMKGCVLGAAAGVVTVLYQGSALRSLLERWVSPAISLSAQGVLLFGFCMMFVLYATLWRRTVRCENRARFLKYVRDRRSFLLSLDTKVTP